MSGAENVHDWQVRKIGQAVRFMERDPSLSMEGWQDYKTTIALVHHGLGTALVIGRLPDAGSGDCCDLTDEQIEAWASPLRVPRQANA